MVRSRHAPSRRGYVHQLVASATWAALPWLPLVRAGTLLLFGDEDPIVHVASGYVLRAVFPRATLRIVEDGGHLFLIYQLAGAAGIVAEFLGAGGRT